jgi:hypothetical protein
MLFAGVGPAPTTAAYGTTACSGPGDFGSEYLSSAWPGGFSGVPVYSDGSEFVSNCYNYATTPSGKSVESGMEWQCVELINRLYISRGWISSTWFGNGDQMYANAPPGLSKEHQGSITHVNPGDVLSFSYVDPNLGGHAAVVAQVSGSAITLVNQNTSSSNTLSHATLSGGNIVMSGWAGYTPIGVIHAPASPRSHTPDDVNGDGRSDLAIATGINGATTGTGKLELHALNGATNFQSSLIDTGTTYNYIDTHYTIPLMADVDGDGRADLCILVGMNGEPTGTGKLEVHCDSAASNFHSSLIDSGTTYNYIDTRYTIPLMADVNGDGRADLCILVGMNGEPTGTGKLEVHCDSAASNFHSSLIDTGTTFGYINTHYTIPLMADVDGDGRADLCILVGMNGATTGTGKLEIHCASAASNFQTRIIEVGTTFGYIDTRYTIPFMADVDGDGRADLCILVGMNGSTTGTGKLEIHCASAASNYQTRVLEVGTAWGYINTDTVDVLQGTYVDSQTAPIVSTTRPSTLVALSTAVPVAWTGSDPSGINHFDVDHAGAYWNAALGPWSMWLSPTTATSATFGGAFGRTYCFKVRAEDNAGNLSDWSNTRCSAVPLRADQVVYSSGWSKVVTSAAYAGFAYETKSHAASMTRTGIVANRIALVLTECSYCGTVQVRWNGTVIANPNTYRSTTVHKQVVQVASWGSAHSGTLQVVVTSATGKPIVIEGLAVYDA